MPIARLLVALVFFGNFSRHAFAQGAPLKVVKKDLMLRYGDYDRGALLTLEVDLQNTHATYVSFERDYSVPATSYDLHQGSRDPNHFEVWVGSLPAPRYRSLIAVDDVTGHDLTAQFTKNGRELWAFCGFENCEPGGDVFAGLTADDFGRLVGDGILKPDGSGGFTPTYRLLVVYDYSITVPPLSTVRARFQIETSTNVSRTDVDEFQRRILVGLSDEFLPSADAGKIEDLPLAELRFIYEEGLDRLLSRGVVRLRQSDHDVRS
jgi:hypothetical protein